MAKADQIKKLIASYGRPSAFRAAALTIIEEEHRKGHTPLAATLRRVLDAAVEPEAAPRRRGLTGPDTLTDPVGELIEMVEPERGRESLILAPDARAALDRVIAEQRQFAELRRHRLPVRSKLLLCGPPGCGKTLTAEVLAHELGVPLLVARIDVVISSLLGQTAANLRRLFDHAGRRPSVLFLDEFDALARTRADANEHNELRRVVNSLLLMIERYKGPGVLVAATNLETALDPALWRRFDEAILLDPPGEAEIAALLALTFRNFKANFELNSHIPKLIGMSYADIERVCFDAIKSTVLARRKAVSETEFAAALRHEGRRRGLAARDR